MVLLVVYVTVDDAISVENLLNDVRDPLLLRSVRAKRVGRREVVRETLCPVVSIRRFDDCVR